ncbi:GerAB/ArcD/ProY family transporter [Paenibacillus guangzhouensis]|uniref:GerAB/ArcD/ProY family transporter n=1 Tax=Paenibacillus guangzhouensis TaxID=1473112 RepID=UPI00126733A0|nr:endospore germination permease [Paenibacillus guangzhouensis]
METRVKLQPYQWMIMVTFFTVGSGTLVIPSGIAMLSRQDAWISALLGLFLGYLINMVHLAAVRNCTNLTWVELNRKLLGKWAGSIVSWVYVITALGGGAVLLLSFLGEFIATSVLVGTPKSVVQLLFILIVAMALRHGLRTIAYSTEVLFPIVIFIYVIMVGLSIPNMELEYILPIFESDMSSILRSTFIYLSFSALPRIFLLILFPSAIESPKGYRAYVTGCILGSLLLILLIATCLLVLGPDVTARKNYPSYFLARKISVGHFLTRIEVFMAAIWLIALFYKLVLYVYVGMQEIAQLLRIRNPKILTYPILSLMIPLSYATTATSHKLMILDMRVWPVFIAIIGLIVPLLLWIVSWVHKWSGKERSDESRSSSEQH